MIGIRIPRCTRASCPGARALISMYICNWELLKVMLAIMGTSMAKELCMYIDDTGICRCKPNHRLLMSEHVHGLCYWPILLSMYVCIASSFFQSENQIDTSILGSHGFVQIAKNKHCHHTRQCYATMQPQYAWRLYLVKAKLLKFECGFQSVKINMCTYLLSAARCCFIFQPSIKRS
jgi:hypothetical protein